MNNEPNTGKQLTLLTMAVNEIEEYARKCVEADRKDAAEKFLLERDWIDAQESILNRPIILL